MIHYFIICFVGVLFPWHICQISVYFLYRTVLYPWRIWKNVIKTYIPHHCFYHLCCLSLIEVYATPFYCCWKTVYLLLMPNYLTSFVVIALSRWRKCYSFSLLMSLVYCLIDLDDPFFSSIICVYIIYYMQHYILSLGYSSSSVYARFASLVSFCTTCICEDTVSLMNKNVNAIFYTIFKVQLLFYGEKDTSMILFLYFSVVGILCH